MNSSSQPLMIGLVNNMGISSMASAKIQFADLLYATGYATELVCFTMRSQKDGTQDHLPIAAIVDFPIDAIIVTGMEVTTPNLQDEWLWSSFTHLYDWAERMALPAIWSCLAAHAAVLHRDGIIRQRLGAKLSGVFNCYRSTQNHNLTNGLPGYWRCPHSRYNGLSRDTLESCGYRTISYSDDAGADIFMHDDNPASFYFQGHPEYKSETLLQEFLRDMRRFISGESANCPAVPVSYLNNAEEAEFSTLRARALAGHNVMPALRSSARQIRFRNGWSDTSGKLYENWLGIVAAHHSSKSAWAAPMDQPAAAGAPLS